MFKKGRVFIKPTYKSEPSEASVSEGKFIFDVYDDKLGKLKCFNKLFYDKILLGEEIEVILNGHTYPIIVGIVGFDIRPIKEYEYPESLPINKSELALYKKLIAEGWDVSRRGWPDFACFREDEFITIEVKPKRSHRLKTRQLRVMKGLEKQGIKCYRWSPDGGFERVSIGVDKL